MKTNLRNIFILLGSTMSVMAGASIAPALPEMSKNFSHIENVEMLVKIMLSIPSLFIALFSPVAGIIIDKYGRKIPLILATILYGLSGTSGFFLNDLYLILVGRALLGVSVAVIMTGYITVIGDLFQGQKLNKFIGIQAAFMSFGGVLFLAVSGLLADIEWRHPFLIYLFAFIILPGLFLFLSETKKEENSRSRKQIFAKEIFKNTVPVYLIAFFSMYMFLIVPVQLPFLLTGISDINNSTIGFLMSLWIFFSAITSLFYKKIRNYFSFNRIFSLAFIIWSCGFILLALFDNLYIIVLGLALAGIGNGLALPNTKVLIITIVSEEFRGRAVGVLTMGFYFGQFFSPIIFSLTMFDNLIQSGFVVNGIMLLITSLVYFSLRNRVQNN
jgi:MFS family permease